MESEFEEICLFDTGFVGSSGGAVCEVREIVVEPSQVRLRGTAGADPSARESALQLEVFISIGEGRSLVRIAEDKLSSDDHAEVTAFLEPQAFHAVSESLAAIKQRLDAWCINLTFSSRPDGNNVATWFGDHDLLRLSITN